MIKGKTYTSLVLEHDSIKVAVVRVNKKKVELVKLDKFSLINPIERNRRKDLSEYDVFGGVDSDLTDDSVFDLDVDSPDEALTELDIEREILGDLGDDIDFDDDIDLELDELEQGEQELVDVDMVDEAEAPVSNEMLLYNILSSINPKKINVSLNIPAGITIYQLLKDVDFNDVKNKDLKVIIDDQIESIYGTPKSEDFYSYYIREDGTLVLTSIDEESQMLQLVNRTLNLYRGKLQVDEILPDESVLIGLVEANYDIDDEGITCIVQFADNNCRVIFMKGNKLWLVSPIITEGTRSKKFLSTVFSKILFQLDTGEVPNLDRMILCNNTIGKHATSFFEERFPDVEVTDFTFTEDFLDPGDYTKDSLAPFTNAIGTAWAITGLQKAVLPEISFLPKYVSDRQKIFKLQWHGVVLLLLILFSIPAVDYFRKDASRTITTLETQISVIDDQIDSYSETVNEFNRISSELTQIQDKLVLLNALAENSITWSVNLDLLNSGIEEIGGVWLTTISVGNEPNSLNIQGLARSRDKIADVAELFSDATLLSVTESEIRDVTIYNFSYLIEEIVPNTSVYTPSNLKGLEDFTGN